MKKLYLYLSAFFLTVSFTISYAQITTIPAGNATNVSICDDGSVIFSTTASGTNISWTFPGGNPSTANGPGPIPVFFDNAGTYTVTLTVDGTNYTKNVTVNNSGNSAGINISNNLTPFGYGQTPPAPAGPNPTAIYYCGNQFGPYNSPNLTFQFTVPNNPATSTVIINWGDGTFDTYAGNVGTVSHIYNCSTITEYEMSVSIIGAGGSCSGATIYTIYSGTAPQISITGNASTHCMPDPYSFMFNSNDIPGTTYEYIFSEPGATAQPINPPFPTPVEHIFGLMSCGQTATIPGPNGGAITYQNAYAASVVATNYCGESFLSIGPIYVSTEPIPLLTMDPGDGFACVDEVVTITNDSQFGMMVSQNGCNPLNKYCYTITPNTGWTLQPGSNMGDCSNPNWIFWDDNVTPDIDVVFNVEGVYYVELTQANACGTVTYIDSICIVAPVEADFTTNVISGCTPLEINVTKDDYVPACFDNSALYDWTVTSTGNAACPIAPVLPDFINGTNANSVEPNFLFTAPGVYSLSLTTGLTNPIPGSACSNDTYSLDITVTQGPNIAFDPYSICANDNITLTNSVEECYAQSTTYDWTFAAAGGPSLTDSDIQEPSLTFVNAGTWPISVEVTNECGSETFNTTIDVSESPLVTINAVSSSCVNLPLPLEAVIVGPATAGTWSVSPNVGTFSSTTSLTPTYTPPNNFTGSLTFTFVTTDAPADCGQITATHPFTYDADATADAGPDVNGCFNGSVNLNGVIGGAASSLTWSASVPGGSFSDPTAANATYTLPAGYTGTITLTLDTNDPPGVCQPDSDQMVITVVTPPTINVTAGTEVCQGGIMPVSATVTGFQTGVTWTAANGNFATPNGLAVNYSAPASYNGPTTITATTLGSSPCPAASQTVNINIIPGPTVNPVAPTVLCAGQLSPVIPFTSPIAGATFNWTFNSGGVVGLGPVGTTGTGPIASFTATNPSPSNEITANMSVTASAAGCTGVPTNFTISVLPNVNVTNPSNSQTICTGSSTAAVNWNSSANSALTTTYNWSVTNTGSVITGFTTPGTGSLPSWVLNLAPGSITPGQLNVTVTPVVNNCNGNPFTYTINVNPPPTLSPITAQTICGGVAFTTPTFNSNIAGTTYSWELLNPSLVPSGVNGHPTSGTGSLNGVVINNSGALPYTLEYEVTPTAAGCPGDPVIFSLTINPAPEVQPSIPNQTICSGGSTLPVTLSSSTPNVNISWTMAPPAFSNGFNVTSGGTTIPAFSNLTNTTPNSAPAPVTATFIAQATTTSGSACPGPNYNYTITINYTPTVDPIADFFACENSTIASFNLTGNATSYDWENNGTAIGDGGSANQVTSFGGFTAINPTNAPIDAIIEVTPIFTGGSVDCPGNTDTFIITVNPQGEVTPINDLAYCNAETATDLNFTTPLTGGVSSYAWNNIGAAAGIGPGQTNVTLFPSFVATNTSSSVTTAQITVSPTFTNGGLACPGQNDTFLIYVNPTPTVNLVNDITICGNSTQNQINFTGTGTEYNWSVIDTQIGNATTSGVNQIPSFTTVDTPTDIIREFTVNPVYTANGISCPGPDMTFNIHVLLTPVAGQLPDVEECNADDFDDVIFTGNGTTYDWFNDNTSIGLGASGLGVLQIDGFTAVNSSGTLSPVSGNVEYVPIYTLNNVSCPGDTLSFDYIVNPTPSVTPIDDIIVCDGSNSTPIVITGNATTYSWTNSSTSVGLGATGIDEIPQFTGLNGTNDVTNTSIIIITPEFTGGGLQCPGVNDTVNVIVNPIPVIDAVSDTTICFGAVTGVVNFTGTGTSYEWTCNGLPNSIGLPTDGQNSTPSVTSLNPNTTPLSNTVIATPVFTTNTVACYGTPTQYDITVLPNPTLDQEDPTSYCTNTSSVQVNYTGVFTSNTWTASNTSIASGGTLNVPGTGSLPVFTTANPSNAVENSSNITVVPFYTFNGLTCEGTDMIHTISILPITTVEQIADFEICNGETSLQFPIVATGTEISWTSSPAIGLVGGNNYFIPTFVAINTDVSQNAPSIVSDIDIYPSYTDVLGLTCQGTPSDFQITVHPTPVIETISNYTVCNFGTVDQDLETNVPTAISWSSTQNAFITGNTTNWQLSTNINNGLVNVSPFPGSPQQTTYSVAAVSVPYGCHADTMEFVVNLMPTVINTSQSSQVICSGNQVGIFYESNVPSTYSWIASSNPNVNGESLIPQTSSSLTDVLTNNSTTNQVVVYAVTPTSVDGNCLGNTQTIAVTVTPPPALVSPTTHIMCSNQAVNYQFVANTNATFTWFGNTNPNVSGISPGTNSTPVITDILINGTGIQQNVTYNVVITSTGAGSNCSSQPIPINVIVNPLPVVTPLTQEICPDETVTFNLQASIPSYFNWVATNNFNVEGETLVATQSNFIQNTLSNETLEPQFVYYNVTPTANSTGCVGLTTQHIAIVNPLPNLAFETSDILCTENPVEFTIAPTTPLNVIWDLGNNQQSTSYTPVTFYDNPGQYVVTLYGINPQTGCEDIEFTTIDILLAPEVDYSVSSTEECLPAFFQFQNTANNPGSVFTWDFDDGTISNEQGIADHVYQEHGCYDVTLTAVAPNGCPNSITYDDIVCAYAIPLAGFIVNDPIQFGDVNEFLFENTTVFGHTYEWDFGDGFTTNAVNPGHIYPIDRSLYNVTLIATNEAGCSDTAMVSIQVQERLIFYVPNTFTPDGNTRNEVFSPVFTSGYDRYTYELIIFNRFGEVMFQSFNDKVGWDGTYGGQVVEDGTYVWKLKFKVLDEEGYREYEGHVNVLK